MLAVRNGLMEVVRTLVNTSGSTDILHEKNSRGDSILHMAAKIERADIIGYLLDKGMSTQEKNRDGMKPRDMCTKIAIKEMLNPSSSNI